MLSFRLSNTLALSPYSFLGPTKCIMFDLNPPLEHFHVLLTMYWSEKTLAHFIHLSNLTFVPWKPYNGYDGYLIPKFPINKLWN